MVTDRSGKLSKAGESPNRENSSRDLRDWDCAPEPPELLGACQVSELTEESPDAPKDDRGILGVFEVPAKGTPGAPAGEAREASPEEP